MKVPPNSNEEGLWRDALGGAFAPRARAAHMAARGGLAVQKHAAHHGETMAVFQVRANRKQRRVHHAEGELATVDWLLFAYAHERQDLRGRGEALTRVI